MSVDFANAFGVSANSANAVVEERNRCIRLKRQQVQIQGVIFFDLWKVPIPVRRSKTPYSMALRVSLRRPSTSPCADVGQRGVVLRLVSRVGQ